jgi:hypothetical protein
VARTKDTEEVGIKVKRGKPPIGEKPSPRELRKLYVRESRSIREIAGMVGCILKER